MSDRVKFRISIAYFKPSGKFYIRDSFVREVRNLGTKHRPICAMEDVASYIRGLRQGDGQGALPGLSGTLPDGFILIDCEEGHPVLILPAKEQ